MASPRASLSATALIVACLGVSACGSSGSDSEQTPAKLVQLSGTNLRAVVLSPVAARRIGLRTGRIEPAGPTTGAPHRGMTEIPYAAVLYDAGGNAFAYTKYAPLTFVRRPLLIDHIAGDRAFLLRGPPAGTVVVTAGDVELLGAEQGVEE